MAGPKKSSSKFRRKLIKVKSKKRTPKATSKTLDISGGTQGLNIGVTQLNLKTGRRTSYKGTIGPRGKGFTARTTGKGGTTFFADAYKPKGLKGSPYKPKTSLNIGVSVPLGRRTTKKK